MATVRKVRSDLLEHLQKQNYSYVNSYGEVLFLEELTPSEAKKAISEGGGWEEPPELAEERDAIFGALFNSRMCFLIGKEVEVTPTSSQPDGEDPIGFNPWKYDWQTPSGDRNWFLIEDWLVPLEEEEV